MISSLQRLLIIAFLLLTLIYDIKNVHAEFFFMKLLMKNINVLKKKESLLIMKSSLLKKNWMN